MNIGEVTLVKDCLICQREVILMARKTVKKQELPKKGSQLLSVCEDCRKKYLKHGTMLLNPKNGSFMVIKDEAFKTFFPEVKVTEQKVCYCDQEVLDKLRPREAK